MRNNGSIHRSGLTHPPSRAKVRPPRSRRRIGRPAPIDFSRLSLTQLQVMSAAGREVRECYRALAKTGDNIVGEVLRDQGLFREWDHYPRDDVYDPVTHAQFYYHAHPAGQRGWAEHGHFHTFLRPRGMPRGAKPADVPPSSELEGSPPACPAPSRSGAGPRPTAPAFAAQAPGPAQSHVGRRRRRVRGGPFGSLWEGVLGAV